MRFIYCACEAKCFFLYTNKKKVEDSAKKIEENNKLKEKLDEFRHYADKLQKSEAMIEK